MDYLFLIIAIVSSVYAYTFGRWLRQNGNKAGAFGVFLLITISVGLAIYHIAIA